MRINPRWALHSMVLAYTGGARDGHYAISIDDNDYTVTITGPSARLAYGPPAQVPLLRLHCTTEAFFRLVTTGVHDGIQLHGGSRQMLNDFVRSLPLEIGPRNTASRPGTRRRSKLS